MPCLKSLMRVIHSALPQVTDDRVIQSALSQVTDDTVPCLKSLMRVIHGALPQVTDDRVIQSALPQVTDDRVIHSALPQVTDDRLTQYDFVHKIRGMVSLMLSRTTTILTAGSGTVFPLQRYPGCAKCNYSCHWGHPRQVR